MERVNMPGAEVNMGEQDSPHQELTAFRDQKTGSLLQGG